ncbi:Putative lipoprotein yceB precursor [Enterobacter hormaechei]|nr:Putative lipoprotein yceB precursor [Enterobacter hormaechei]
MKKIVIAAALIVSGLLVGCNQLTQYTVSEQEINQALEKIITFQKISACPALRMRISS